MDNIVKHSFLTVNKVMLIAIFELVFLTAKLTSISSRTKD